MRRYCVTFIGVLFFAVFACAQDLSETEVMATMNKAFMLNKDERYKEALEAFLLVGKNTEKQRTEEERQLFVVSQTMAALCYEMTGGYEDGYLLCRKLLQGKLTDEEKKNVAFQFVLNGYMVAVSYINIDVKRYEEARALFDEILPYADEDMKRSIQPKIPLAWYFEGSGYMMAHQYDKAYSCMNNARRGYKEMGDAKGETDALGKMAVIKAYQDEYISALDLYEDAYTCAQTGEDWNLMADIRHEQRRIYRKLGDRNRVTAASQAIDSLFAKAGNVEAMIANNNTLGDDALEMKDYLLAESFYLKNEKLLQQLPETKQRIVAHGIYTKMRDLKSRAGDYPSALAYGANCIKMFETELKGDRLQRYLPYENQADIYREMGDSVNAMRCIDTLFLSLEGTDVPPRIMAQVYTTRGRVLTGFKEYGKAISDYDTADGVLAKMYGPEDADRMTILALKAGALHRLNRYEESEEAYRQYAGLIKRTQGDRSMAYGDALYYLANAEAFNGHIDAGHKHYMESVEMLEQQIKEQLRYVSSFEREGYWESLSQKMWAMTAFAIKSQAIQSEFTEASYNALLFSKSILLESERSMYDIIRSEGSQADVEAFANVAALKDRIGMLNRNFDRNREEIGRLYAEMTVADKRLAARSTYYKDYTAFLNVKYADVKRAMRDGDVLIDFTDFKGEDGKRQYVMYIINKGQEHPLLKSVFTEEWVDSLLGGKSMDCLYDEDVSEKFYRLCWKPVQEHVKTGAKVYYVPSGLMHRISLESLRSVDGGLLGDHYDFVRLSSARELLRQSDATAIADGSKAVLYGGLLYDLDTHVLEAESRKYDLPIQLALRGGNVRGDSVFHYLPQTKEEILAVERILKGKNVEVTSYMGIEGTEESFLNMSGKAPKLLLVATHGFYYSPDHSVGIDYLRGYTDAMSLTGLVMAGGNLAWRGKQLPEGVLGGILTANTISRMDLRGTELAVLSACQTGRGEVTSEGVYGLQRAFKKAGVQTLIMTLWDVSDFATKEFMTAFFTEFAKNGWKKRNAFDKARRVVREKFPEPYYWAGFVMLD